MLDATNSVTDKMNSRYKYEKKDYQQGSKKTRHNLKSISCQKNVKKASDSESN